jgi:hypothetical protein
MKITMRDAEWIETIVCVGITSEAELQLAMLALLDKLKASVDRDAGEVDWKSVSFEKPKEDCFDGVRVIFLEASVKGEMP